MNFNLRSSLALRLAWEAETTAWSALTAPEGGICAQFL